MPTALEQPDLMSLDEFLAWDPPDGKLWQLIDGEPKAMAPPGPTQAAIRGDAARVIGNHLVEHRPGFTLLVTPGVVPRVRSNMNARLPDPGVTCAPVAEGDAVVENPVLLIEILSPGNRAETWANVWAYTTIPSVAEVVVISTSEVAADLLRRGPDGNWPKGPVRIKPSDTLVLNSIGFSIGSPHCTAARTSGNIRGGRFT
jgi:Uma2 family endonuclease